MYHQLCVFILITQVHNKKQKQVITVCSVPNMLFFYLLIFTFLRGLFPVCHGLILSPSSVNHGRVLRSLGVWRVYFPLKFCTLSRLFWKPLLTSLCAEDQRCSAVNCSFCHRGVVRNSPASSAALAFSLLRIPSARVCILLGPYILTVFGLKLCLGWSDFRSHHTAQSHF